MSLLVVGSVALDNITTPKGQVSDSLGGSATYFSVAASKVSKVHMVGVVGEDFAKTHLEKLRNCGIDMNGLYVDKGKTFRWTGIYDEDFSDPETINTELNVFADFSPNLPDSYCNLPYIFLGNIHPALQLQVAEQMKKTALLAADTMNFWIEGERKKLLDVIKNINMLFLNELELRLLTGLRSPLAGAEKLLSWGPDWVVLKRGVYGSMLVGKDDELFVLPAYPTKDIIDPTGAGDSFGGGMMGYISRENQLTKETIRTGLVYGTVAASFCIEGFSIDRLMNATDMEFQNRLEKLREMTRF